MRCFSVAALALMTLMSSATATYQPIDRVVQLIIENQPTTVMTTTTIRTQYHVEMVTKTMTSAVARPEATDPAGGQRMEDGQADWDWPVVEEGLPRCSAQGCAKCRDRSECDGGDTA